MSGARRVAVLKGGRSLERAVSLRSGAQVQDALERLGHEVLGVDLGEDLVPRLLELSPEVAFVALHGREGEDGTVQGLLEAIGVPYTGSAPAACARATDKVLAKRLMREAGIPTPEFHVLHEDSIRELGAGAALPAIEAGLGFPLVVKPARGGSALGVKFASAGEHLAAALVGAFSYDRTILLERYVRGRDLAVSLLDGDAGPVAQGSSARAPASARRPSRAGARSRGAPLALPIVEAVPREEGFYDYESRYEIGMTTFLCPAELDSATSARAQELAVEVYGLLGCHGVARVDLMLEHDTGELWVLETNVVPGLTETSLLPQAADAGGVGFDDLIERILKSAFSR